MQRHSRDMPAVIGHLRELAIDIVAHPEGQQRAHDHENNEQKQANIKRPAIPTTFGFHELNSEPAFSLQHALERRADVQ